MKTLLLIFIALASCGRGEPEREVLAALGQVKGYHHLADVHLAEGHPELAVAALEKILAVPFPAGATDGEDARIDARARLGKVLLDAGRLADARRVVDEGLAATTRDSFFLANLYTVSGQLHEAAARAPGADIPAERRAAIESYSRSIEINERIQKQLVEAKP